MARYLLQRLAGLIFVLFAISVITFTLMHAVPGGPWDATARNPLPEETRTALAHEFGFDRPLYEQYALYMWSALHLNFGVPFESPGETVAALIARTWPVTAVLGGATLLGAILLGGPPGIPAGLRPNTWGGSFLTLAGRLGFAPPHLPPG